MFFIIVVTVFPKVGPNALAGDLIWPVDCIPAITCNNRIGYPDIDWDGQAFDCSAPGYAGHQGTDIGITWSKMDSGVSVFAAADGIVLWVFDGKYDRCPDLDNPDCQAPPPGWFVAGESNGYRVCTERGNYCGTGSCCCFWCFDGGNVVVIKHPNVPGIFATRYDHLKTNSILVSPGEFVQQGQKIAEVGSSGHSTGPHLHFEVWGTGYYVLADPWEGPCGPNFDNSLWKNDPPYARSKGDIDGNAVIDLADAIIGLRVLADFDTSSLVGPDYATSGADVDGDSNIGLAEIAYIMQEVSGLR